MAHAILYGRFKLDKNGQPIWDKEEGHFVRDKRCGQKKAAKDITPAERQTVEDQHRHFNMTNRLKHQDVLAPITEALQKLNLAK